LAAWFAIWSHTTSPISFSIFYPLFSPPFIFPSLYLFILLSRFC
jgi:hypothetical protein